MAIERRSPYGTTSLVDVLDRVLDKGLVVAGDIRISLANVELLTVRIRLLICSIDKAEQIGLNWWRYDRSLVAPPDAEGDAEVIGQLEARIAQLERQLAQAQSASPAPAPAGAARRSPARTRTRPRRQAQP